MASRRYDGPSSTDVETLHAMFHNRERHDPGNPAGLAMRAYWAGAIESHCAQNAIDSSELRIIATDGGYDIDWPMHLLSSAPPLRAVDPS